MRNFYPWGRRTSLVLKPIESAPREREELEDDDDDGGGGADGLSVEELVGVEDFGTKAKDESPRATRLIDNSMDIQYKKVIFPLQIVPPTHGTESG